MKIRALSNHKSGILSNYIRMVDILTNNNKAVGYRRCAWLVKLRRAIEIGRRLFKK